jgi:hypothetical protein
MTLQICSTRYVSARFNGTLGSRSYSDVSFQTLDQIGIGQDSGRVYLKCLQSLCGASGVLPASFILTDGFDDIEERPFASGGSADLYKATYMGRQVVAKTLKAASGYNPEDSYKVSREITLRSYVFLMSRSQSIVNEVIGWRWLRHENILPFVGVSLVPSPFSIVSAWMEKGDIMRFVKATPDQNPFSLVSTPCFAVGIPDLMRSSWT